LFSRISSLVEDRRYVCISFLMKFFADSPAIRTPGSDFDLTNYFEAYCKEHPLLRAEEEHPEIVITAENWKIYLGKKQCDNPNICPSPCSLSHSELLSSQVLS